MAKPSRPSDGSVAGEAQAPGGGNPLEAPAVEPSGVEPVGDLLVVDEETGGLSATGWLLLVLALVILTAPAWLLWALPAVFGVGVLGLVRRRQDRRLGQEIDEGLRNAPQVSDASRRAFQRERAAMRRVDAHRPAGERGQTVQLDTAPGSEVKGVALGADIGQTGRCQGVLTSSEEGAGTPAGMVGAGADVFLGQPLRSPAAPRAGSPC